MYTPTVIRILLGIFLIGALAYSSVERLASNRSCVLVVGKNFELRKVCVQTRYLTQLNLESSSGNEK